MFHQEEHWKSWKKAIIGRRTKKQIASIQAEQECLMLVMSKFMDNIVTTKEPQAIKSQKEAIVRLSNDILSY
jgi:hypothetical protein